MIEDIVKRTIELMKFRTVRPIGIEEIRGCMKYIESELKGFELVKEDFTGDCPIIVVGKDKKPDLMMIGHVDVVDSEEFTPTIKDGKICGRGSKDMKSGVAVMIEAVKHLGISAAFVSDEESGGFDGASRIVNEMGYRPKFVWTPDPGDKHGIVNKEKGIIWAYLTVYGQGSHASRPWLGECAYSKAFRVYEKVLKEFNHAKYEEDWRTTATLSRMDKVLINGEPDDSNAMAGSVKMKFDIRYTEHESPGDIEMRLKSICSDTRVEVIGNVTYTEPQLLKGFKKCVDYVEGRDVPLIASAGASDLRFFSSKGIPCVNYGQKGANHHRPGEYVEISSLEQLYKVVEKIVRL